MTIYKDKNLDKTKCPKRLWSGLLIKRALKSSPHFEDYSLAWIQSDVKCFSNSSSCLIPILIEFSL